jgi:glycosyltransferase involved in cell wall biosynthesis
MSTVVAIGGLGGLGVWAFTGVDCRTRQSGTGNPTDGLPDVTHLAIEMTGPLVSIITPTLNQGRFIEATIRSIRGQTYDHYEHIVVDGGSTDATLEILRRHEGAYPMRWLSEPDRGMYDAVNKGLRLATGDILCYLNSDDLYFPWTLETVVEAFAAHPEADLVCGDCVRSDADAGTAYLLFQPPPFQDFVRRSGYLAQPTVFWRRQVTDGLGGFDTGLQFVADCDYWMRAAARHHIAKIDEFLAVDTIQEAAKRSTNALAVAIETDAVRSRYVRTSGIPHQLRRLRNRAWAAWWRRVSWCRLLVSSRRGSSAEARPWNGWLSQPEVRLRYGHALAAQLPLIGERFAVSAVRMEPAARDRPVGPVAP